MGTILTHEQVNPWAVMGANLAGNLIGDMIQRSREAEQNRKLNALFNEAINSVNVPQAQTLSPLSAALQQTGNIGEAVTPFPTQQVNNIPDAQTMRNAILQNLGTQRFSMLDPAKVEQYMAPYYQGMEQQRNEAMKRDYADKLMNAQNSSDRRNIAWSGAAESVLPWDVVNMANNEYRYDNMSAAEEAANLFRDRQFNENRRQFDTQTGLNYAKLNQDDRHFDANLDYNLGRDAQSQNNWEREFAAKRADTRYERQNPGYSSVFTGDDGGQWMVDKFGNTKKLNTGESNSGARLSQIEQDEIDRKTARIKDLENQRQEFYKLRTDILKTNITGEANTRDYDDRIASIDDDIRQLTDEVKQIYKSKQQRQQIQDKDVIPAGMSNNTNSQDIGLLTLSGAKVHPHGTFGYDRGDHKHDGTDYYSIKEGTAIPVHAQMGDNLTVKAVGFDNGKNGKGGYGNYVKLEADRNGKKVEYLFGHLQDKSIKVKQGQQVKAGDIIANVGNTGRSSGPHLHLRIKVNGKSVDPQKFLTEYGNLENSENQYTPTEISQEDYNNFRNEYRKKGYSDEQINKVLESQGLTFNKGIQSEDVTPPFSKTTSSDVAVSKERPHYGLDRRKFYH